MSKIRRKWFDRIHFSLSIDKEKCLFGKLCLNFLGHNIKEKGIQAAEEKFYQYSGIPNQLP